MMNTTIIGLGLIGGSMAKDLRKTGFSTRITGIEINESNAKEALKLGLVDKIAPFPQGLEDAELVIIAIPVDKELEMLPTVLDHISERATVIDMGSTKKMLVETVRKHPKRRNFVPAHPMSGTENSGPSAAIDDLFKDKIAIVCDEQDSGAQHLALAEKMFHKIGMNIAYMSADEQDHSTAFVSHLPHAAAFALANAVITKEDRNIIFDLASGGFRSTVRLAKSSGTMWKPIFQQNRQYVVESLNVYIKHLKEFTECLKEEDDQKLGELILRANEIRGILDGEQDHLVKNEEKLIKYYTK